jgi:hypothetical protein
VGLGWWWGWGGDDGMGWVELLFNSDKRTHVFCLTEALFDVLALKMSQTTDRDRKVVKGEEQTVL